ncbi:MAG: DNA-binding protein [Gammaproteobacteria bacterium]|nr:MAG: DNA-binding protein [Gammaproteobacteria bacterium]
MRKKGKLTSWNDGKGFGFITPNDNAKRIFVHANAFNRRAIRPEINQIITYSMSVDKRGRPCAINASRAGEDSPKKAQKPSRPIAVFFAFCFLMIVAAAVFINRLPMIIFGIYSIISLITFAFYALDKSAAQSGSWRTKENTLHLLALIGGWPGALVAQSKLRHKSSKQSFRITFWITVIINVAGFIWLLTPRGSAELYFFLAEFNISI